MKINSSVLRIFNVRARAGSADALKRKLADTSVSVVSGKPGNSGYLFGEQLSSDGNDLVFISVWEDLESIRAHFGVDWEQSFLPDGYEALIETCSLQHVEVDGNYQHQSWIA